MRTRLLIAVVIGLVATMVPLGAHISLGADCPDMAPPPLAFDTPKFIDKTRAGGEPVSIVAQDGSISVSAHAGTTHIYKDPAALGGIGDFANGYTNQVLNWRSTDGGDSWQYIGIGGLREGPHSATSTGFSDPDFAMDAGGRIYNTEINLANVSVFSSLDDGQSYAVGHPEVTSGDRPWLTGGDKDEVFLYVNTLQQIFRSTDGGLTWGLQSIGNGSGPTSKMVNDPLNFKTGLVAPHGRAGLTISADEGKTWKPFDGADLGSTVDFFGELAVDKAGNAYKASAGGYRGSSDTTPDGEVWFNYFTRDAAPTNGVIGGKWNEAVQLDIPDGDAMWPWVIAGDDGRAAVVWYQNFAGKPNEFYAMAAYTQNAHGTTVTCSDGSTQFVPPQFSVTNASGRPIHIGKICLDGTTCNASPDFPAGDRRLGDFFTINYDANGDLFIVSGDTTLRSPTGGQKPVGNPIFIKQSAGAPLLETPMPVRKTRCLTPLPSC